MDNNLLYLKIKNLTFFFKDWVPYNESNRGFQRVEMNGNNFIHLVPTWSGSVDEKINFNLHVYFQGSEIFFLNSIYKEFYNPYPIFSAKEIDLAQHHADNFVKKFNALKVFL